MAKIQKYDNGREYDDACLEATLVSMGQIAYEAFLEHTRNYDSNPHPGWHELNADQQTSWDVASYTVVKNVIIANNA